VGWWSWWTRIWPLERWSRLQLLNGMLCKVSATLVGAVTCTLATPVTTSNTMKVLAAMSLVHLLNYPQVMEVGSGLGSRSTVSWTYPT